MGSGIIKKVFPVYLLCAAVGVAAYAFLSANTEWALYPYTKALNVIFGFHFYFTGVAYEAAGSNLVLSKTCSGINTFLSVYAILVFGFLHHFAGAGKRLRGFLLSFAAAIGIAYGATLLRIIVSLPFCDSRHFYLIHNIITLCIFYGAGLAVYTSAQKIVLHFTRNDSSGVLHDLSCNEANKGREGFGQSPGPPGHRCI